MKNLKTLTLSIQNDEGGYLYRYSIDLSKVEDTKAYKLKTRFSNKFIDAPEQSADEIKSEILYELKERMKDLQEQLQLIADFKPNEIENQEKQDD